MSHWHLAWVDRSVQSLQAELWHTKFRWCLVSALLCVAPPLVCYCLSVLKLCVLSLKSKQTIYSSGISGILKRFGSLGTQWGEKQETYDIQYRIGIIVK